MAQVFLPCESQQWPQDKEYFKLLSNVKSSYEFKELIDTRSTDHVKPASPDEHKVSLGQRLKCLKGLAVFLTNVASEEEKELFFTTTLPFVCRVASCLDVLVPEDGVPFVIQQEGVSIHLGRKLVLSLIANAFLCTFPHEHPLGCKNRNPFTFEKFFDIIASGDYSRQSSQVAKLRCFLNYFYRMSQGEEEGNPGIVTYTRQVVSVEQIPSLNDWKSSDYPLCPLSIDSVQTIEDTGSRNLQVDFAAAHIGGGTLRGGRVQEEIRFSICPELLVSMLIMDTMDDNETIIISGYERFAYYNGYGSTLKYGGNYVDPSERDVFGNLNTCLVAINAVNFQDKFKQETQYFDEMILRELNKSFVGFLCKDERGDLLLDAVALGQGEYDDDKFVTSAMGEEEEEGEEEEIVKTGVQDFANNLVDNIFDNLLTSSSDVQTHSVSSPEVESPSLSSLIEEEGEGVMLSFINTLVQDAVKAGIQKKVERSDTPLSPSPPPSPSPPSSPSPVPHPPHSSPQKSTGLVKMVPIATEDGPKSGYKKGSKLKGHGRRGSGGLKSNFAKSYSLSSNEGGSLDLLDPAYIYNSVSRMSIAWSTTSTHDDSSMPASPTELDHIALGMIDNLEDYSTLVTDLAIRGALLSLKQSEELTSTSLIPYFDDTQQTKIDTFLHSLEEARPIDLINNEKAMLPYSPRWYNIQKNTLRPVATGNWGCGAFKGDPQLKALLQWMAVSCNGRPELKYCTFKDTRMEQFSEVLDTLSSIEVNTVGSLCNLVLDYCKKSKGKTSLSLFNYILNLKSKK